MENGIEVPRIQKGLTKMAFDRKLIDDAVISALSRGHIPTDGTRFPMVEKQYAERAKAKFSKAEDELPLAPEGLLIDAPAISLGIAESTQILSLEQQNVLQDLSVSMSLATTTVARPGIHLTIESRPSRPAKPELPKAEVETAAREEKTKGIELALPDGFKYQSKYSAGTPDMWTADHKSSSGSRRRKLPTFSLTTATATIGFFMLALEPIGTIWPLLKPVFKGEIAALRRIHFRRATQGDRTIAGEIRDNSQQFMTENDELRELKALRALKTKSR